MKKMKILVSLPVFSILALLFVLQYSLSVQAGNKSFLTYHGRITKADGTLVSAASVSMSVQILGPDGCLLWQETLPAQNFSNSKGSFSVSIGSGANSAAGALTWDKIFQNGVALGAGALAGTGCSGTFNGAATDDRTLYMTFNDGSGAQTVGPVAVKTVMNNALVGGYPYIGTPANNDYLKFNGTNWYSTPSVGVGFTNVTLQFSPAIFGSVNMTADGTYTATAANQSAKTFFAGPTNGVPAAPSFRAIAPADLGTGTADATTYLRGDGTWATPSGGMTNPMTTLGDVIYGGAAGAPTRLAGNATATNKFLTSVSAGAPTWNALAAGDIPNLNISVLTGGLTSNALLQVNSFGTGVVNTTCVAGQLLYWNGVTGWTCGNVSNLTAAGSLVVANGGTGLSSGTSGGIPYFNSGTTMASSGVLAANQVMIGGGAGVAPSTLAAGANTHVLTMVGGVPTWQLPAAGGGALSAITSAAGTNTLTNAANAQFWNWQMSAPGTAGMTFGETAASTGGGTTQDLVQISTLAASTANPLHVKARGAEALMVDKTGNVGIGTATPAYQLDVVGNIANSSQFLSANGSAANPSISFRNQSNMGFYRNGSGMTWVTGGADKITFDGSGNVGIGTTSPSFALDVSTSVTATTGTLSGGRVKTTFTPSGASTATNYSFQARADTGGANNISGVVMGLYATATHYGTGTASSLYGSQNLALVSFGGGNVTNAYGLQSRIYNQSAATISNAYGNYIEAPSNSGGGVISNYYGLYIGQPTVATNNFALYSEGATNYFGGNVGIGTPTPNTILDVSGALSMREMVAPAVSPLDQGRIYFDSTANKFKVSENNGAYVDLVGGGSPTFPLLGSAGSAVAPTYSFSGDPDTGIYNGAANQLYISTGGNVRARIGSYGITSYSGIYAADGTAASPSISFDSGTNSGLYQPSAGSLGISSNGVERMRIDTSGNVGIGTTAPESKLDVNGAVTMRQAYYESVGVLGSPACGSTNITAFTTNIYTVTACASGTTTLNIPTITGWPAGNMSWVVTFYVTGQASSVFNVSYNGATTAVYWDKNSTGGSGGASYPGFTVTSGSTDIITCTVLNTGSVKVYCGVAAQY